MKGGGLAPMRASRRVFSRTVPLSLAGLKEEARRRGFSHILTAGGPVSLDWWMPWGGPMVDYRLDTPRFVIVGEGMVQDTLAHSGVRAALWPLMRPEVG